MKIMLTNGNLRQGFNEDMPVIRYDESEDMYILCTKNVNLHVHPSMIKTVNNQFDHAFIADKTLVIEYEVVTEGDFGFNLIISANAR